MDEFAFARKGKTTTESSNNPSMSLIVQIVFGVSEHTSCQIQLNCLNIQGALAWVSLDTGCFGLDGLCHIGNFSPPHSPLFLRLYSC